MKRFIPALAAAFLAASALTVSANEIKSVMAIDFLTVEVVMDEPLTEEALSPKAFLGGQRDFLFGDGAAMTGAPVPQKEDNTYRIPVNGLREDWIYTISYDHQKPRTFKTYRTVREMEEKYKARFGDYF